MRLRQSRHQHETLGRGEAMGSASRRSTGLRFPKWWAAIHGRVGGSPVPAAAIAVGISPVSGVKYAFEGDRRHRFTLPPSRARHSPSSGLSSGTRRYLLEPKGTDLPARAVPCAQRHSSDLLSSNCFAASPGLILLLPTRKELKAVHEFLPTGTRYHSRTG